jgi:hypothetical protein
MFPVQTDKINPEEFSRCEEKTHTAKEQYQILDKLPRPPLMVVLEDFLPSKELLANDSLGG